MDAIVNRCHSNNSVSNKKIRLVLFGNCKYYPEKKTISRKNEVITLTNKPALLIEYLYLNQGRVISKSDIANNVWPNRHLSDATLHTTIGVLRKALGDSRKEKIYISNSSGSGYIFLPEVKFCFYPDTDYRNGFKYFLFLFLFLFLIYFFDFKSTNHYNASQHFNLTSLNGVEFEPSASKDGSEILFSHEKPKEIFSNIYIKNIKMQNYSQLTSDALSIQNRSPVFSPDNSKIAWVRTDYKEVCDLMVANYDSKNKKLIDKKSIYRCVSPNIAMSPSWKNEKSIYFSISFNEHDEPNSIVEIDLLTRELFRVVTPKELGRGIFFVRYNKDSNQIAHIRQSISSGSGAEVWVYDLHSKKDRLVKSYGNLFYSLAWVNKNELITNGENGLEVISITGDVKAIHTKKRLNQYYPFKIKNNIFGFMEGDFYLRNLTFFSTENNVAFGAMSSTEDDYHPSISKKTNEIAFVSTRGKLAQIYVGKNNRVKQLTNFSVKKQITEVSISPYGKYISYIHNHQLTILNRNGDELYTSNDMDISNASFSYDEKHVIYTNNLFFRKDVVKMKVIGGKRIVVASGNIPRIDEVGNIFYFKNKRLIKQTTKKGIIKLEKSQKNIKSIKNYDIINEHIFYVDNEKNLVKEKLFDKETAQFKKISGNTFSINNNESIIVSSNRFRSESRLVSFFLESVSTKKL